MSRHVYPYRLWSLADLKRLDTAIAEKPRLSAVVLAKKLASSFNRTVMALAQTIQYRRRQGLPYAPPSSAQGDATHVRPHVRTNQNIRWSEVDLRRIEDASRAAEATGESVGQVAERLMPLLGRNKRAITFQIWHFRKYGSRAGSGQPPWSEAEIQSLIKWRRRGWTIQEIADKLKRPYTLVKNACKRHVAPKARVRSCTDDASEHIPEPSVGE